MSHWRQLDEDTHIGDEIDGKRVVEIKKLVPFSTKIYNYQLRTMSSAQREALHRSEPAVALTPRAEKLIRFGRLLK